MSQAQLVLLLRNGSVGQGFNAPFRHVPVPRIRVRALVAGRGRQVRGLRSGSTDIVELGDAPGVEGLSIRLHHEEVLDAALIAPQESETKIQS